MAQPWTRSDEGVSYAEQVILILTINFSLNGDLCDFYD